MKDVVRATHGYLLEPLERIFADCQGEDVVLPDGQCAYRPKYSEPSMISNEVKRRMMVLAYRGGLKTSINVIAHTIQFLLNFPHAAVMIYHNKDDRADELVGKIREHFTLPLAPRKNHLATLFPEFCLEPTPKDLRKYGGRGRFICPARERLPHEGQEIVVEPSVMGVALGVSQAGYHVDAIKFTDIVEENNSETAEALAKGWRRFNTALNLPKDPYCFVYVEGTIYEMEDTYTRILQSEWFGLPPEQRVWDMVYCPAYVKDAPAKALYTPDAMRYPFKVADKDVVVNGRAVVRKDEWVPHWPVWKDGRPKFDVAALEEKRRANEEVFAKQQLLDPIMALGSMGFSPSHYQEIPYEAERALAFTKKIMGVDTAESETGESDSAVLTAGFTNRGLVVVTDAVVGKLQPEDLIDEILAAYVRQKPDLVRIEDTPFVRGWKLSLEREMNRRGMFMPIEYVPRNTATSKDQRIKGALRTPMSQGRIKFSQRIDEVTRGKIRMEIVSFPKSRRKDALDALSDIVTGELDPVVGERNSPEVERERERREQAEWIDKMWERRTYGTDLPSFGRVTETAISDWG